MEKVSSTGLWILIPARGGSKGVPRKNLRHLAGKPLILHVLERMAKAFTRERVVVSTDDEEIGQLCQSQARIHPRSSASAADVATLDDVAFEVGQWLLKSGARAEDCVVTVQPTSPFIEVGSIQRSVEMLAKAKSVVSVKDDRHLRWTTDDCDQSIPLFDRRVNRQWLPPSFAETGGVIGTRLGDLLEAGTRIQVPTALLVLDQYEGLDIDSYADWAVAEFFARRKRIVIRADANTQLGMGHVYRAVALAHELAEHDLVIATRSDGDNRLGVEFLDRHPYSLQTLDNEEEFFRLLEKTEPAITIVDVLDTEEQYTQQIKLLTKFLVTFEDLGSGNCHADLVINDLYTDVYPQQNHWYGVSNAILAPQFETVVPKQKVCEKPENILVAFGGTDPMNLTVKALFALQSIGFDRRVTVILGLGYTHGDVNLDNYGLDGTVLRSVNNMARIMSGADIAITSAGRTVTELMSLGVPTMVLCQNERELRHNHASSSFGVVNLGLGEHVAVSTVGQHLNLLINNAPLRNDMHVRALRAVRGRSNRHITERLLQLADGSQGKQQESER